MLFNLPFFDTILKRVIIPNLQTRKQGQRGICKVTRPITNRFPTNRASQMALELKNLPANAGDIRDAGSIPGCGRFPEEKKWQPTPVFLPGKSHGQRSLVGYSPWGCKASVTNECTRVCTCTHVHTHSQ